MLCINSIPIKNIWLLILYASDILEKLNFEKKGQAREDNPEELMDMVIEILVAYVRKSLQHGFTQKSRSEEADLARVRGRIDIRRTYCHKLLAKGRVACKFFSPTLDSPRYRYLRAALEKAARLTELTSNAELRQKCLTYAGMMKAMGICGKKPDKAELERDVLGLNDRQDKKALSAARLVFEIAIPLDESGRDFPEKPRLTHRQIYALYEKAILGFYRFHLAGSWLVGQPLAEWPIEAPSSGSVEFLPWMRYDIVLENAKKRIIIDTKFMACLVKNRFGQVKYRSSHIFQIYSYLRSQEKADNEKSLSSTGILLYPSTNGEALNNVYHIQGHKIIIGTVNLAGSPMEIRRRLLELAEF